MNSRILYVDNRPSYIKSHRMPWIEAAQEAGFEVHVTALTSGDARGLHNCNFQFHNIAEHGRSNNPLREILIICRLFKLFYCIEPDLIHQITLRSILYGSVATLFLRTPKIVNGVTGLGYLFSSHEVKIRALRKALMWSLRILRREDHVFVFQNPDDELLFQRHHIVEPSSSALIKGSGVDTQRFKPQPEPSGPPVVLFPARMLWHKGVKAFVDAARHLKAEGIEVRFVMVGNIDWDNPAGVSEERLEEWEKEGVVEWWGYQKDMPGVFARSHIVCLPSAYREGVPKVLIEAASCGRPIVTTDMPGCREIVQDGENGYLVPPRDGEAVAQSVQKLVEDPELRQRMGRRGRERVEAEFSVEQVVQSTVEVYKQILNKHSNPVVTSTN